MTEKIAICSLFSIPCPLSDVDFTEDVVLNRVGILKFVDQSCWKLCANDLGQPFISLSMQGVMHTGQQVVKTHFGSAFLFLPDTLSNSFRCMNKQRRINFKRGQLLIEAVKSLIGRVFRFRFIFG